MFYVIFGAVATNSVVQEHRDVRVRNHWPMHKIRHTVSTRRCIMNSISDGDFHMNHLELISSLYISSFSSSSSSSFSSIDGNIIVCEGTSCEKSPVSNPYLLYFSCDGVFFPSIIHKGFLLSRILRILLDVLYSPSDSNSPMYTLCLESLFF